MYVILSHPAYDNQKFRVYSDIPQEFKTSKYAPEIFTTARTFSSLYHTPASQRWEGEGIDARMLVPYCIEIGGNPLIVRSHIVRFFNPEPLKTVPLSRKSILTIYNDLLEVVAVRKDHDGLFAKLAESIGYNREYLSLTEIELKQLHSILGIELVIEKPTKTLDPDLPPRGVPLIDMSQYEFPLDENGDPILPPEYANIEPAFDEPSIIPAIRPTDSIMFGQSKADRLRYNRTKRRKV